MVAFGYGEWDVICRISPQPICNLLFRQLLVHPDHGVEAAPDPYLNLPQDDGQGGDVAALRQEFIKSAGIGIRASCTIPRMQSTGGQVGSVGNTANIVICCLSIIVVWFLISKSIRRKAAVARIELIILLVLYGLMKFFEIFDTGSVLQQGSQSIVWITSIHLSLTVIFFFTLIWFGFLALQLLEDGTLFSLLPLSLISTFLFIGSIYIFLDTGFGLTHYFSSQPASHLYSPWTFSLIILWPLISMTIYVFITILVSIRTLSELKPVIISIAGIITLTLAEIFRWILTQPICHSSNAKVDGSFMASLLELITLIILVYIWVCLTEAEWDDFNDLGYQHYPTGSANLNAHGGGPGGAGVGIVNLDHKMLDSPIPEFNHHNLAGQVGLTENPNVGVDVGGLERGVGTTRDYDDRRLRIGGDDNDERTITMVEAEERRDDDDGDGGDGDDGDGDDDDGDDDGDDDDDDDDEMELGEEDVEVQGLAEYRDDYNPTTSSLHHHPQSRPNGLLSASINQNLSILPSQSSSLQPSPRLRRNSSSSSTSRSRSSSSSRSSGSIGNSSRPRSPLIQTANSMIPLTPPPNHKHYYQYPSTLMISHPPSSSTRPKLVSLSSSREGLYPPRSLDHHRPHDRWIGNRDPNPNPTLIVSNDDDGDHHPYYFPHHHSNDLNHPMHSQV